jgi:hypothetical protein
MKALSFEEWLQDQYKGKHKYTCTASGVFEKQKRVKGIRLHNLKLYYQNYLTAHRNSNSL